MVRHARCASSRYRKRVLGAFMIDLENAALGLTILQNYRIEMLPDRDR
jgi:hypothetical protein